MSDQDQVDSLLEQHRAALNDYRKWDEIVKQLLKGRKVKDLAPEDMESYREAAKQRDMAYDRMRHLERNLLDDIPGASTGRLARPRLDDE
jgi:hypothetical protein